MIAATIVTVLMVQSAAPGKPMHNHVSQRRRPVKPKVPRLQSRQPTTATYFSVACTDHSFKLVFVAGPKNRAQKFL